jgi:hypothetical protein
VPFRTKISTMKSGLLDTGTKFKCDVQMKSKQQPEFHKAMRPILKTVLGPALTSVTPVASAAGSGATTDVYAAQAAAIASAAPLSASMQAKVEAGTICDAKAFTALMHATTTVEWFASAQSMFRTDLAFLAAIQGNEDFNKFMIGAGLQPIATPAGKIFSAAAAKLEELVAHLRDKFTGGRRRRDGEIWVKLILRLADEAFTKPYENMFLGVHATTQECITGDHYWGLMILVRNQVMGHNQKQNKHANRLDKY